MHNYHYWYITGKNAYIVSAHRREAANDIFNAMNVGTAHISMPAIRCSNCTDCNKFRAPKFGNWVYQPGVKVCADDEHENMIEVLPEDTYQATH